MNKKLIYPVFNTLIKNLHFTIRFDENRKRTYIWELEEKDNETPIQNLSKEICEAILAENPELERIFREDGNDNPSLSTPKRDSSILDNRPASISRARGRKAGKRVVYSATAKPRVRRRGRKSKLANKN